MAHSRSKNLMPLLLSGGILASLVGCQAMGAHEESASFTPASVAVAPPPLQTSPTDDKVVHGPGAQVDWNAISKRVADSVVSLRVSAQMATALGSGVILREDGTIVTNAHVVKSAGDGQGDIQVILNDNTVYEAKIVKSDERTDLAVIKMENPPRNLRPLPVGDSSKAQVGDPVLAIGNPLGLSGTVTNGIVSSLNRPMSSSRNGESGDGGPTTTTNTIQTNAAINQGNSGGALVNAQGQLIGINSSIATTGNGTGNIGIGFAIPSNTMKRIVEYLEVGREFPYAKLGISVFSGIGKDGKVSRLGAVVQEVLEGSGAAKAGLRAGDVVTKVNDVAVTSNDSLVAEIRTHPGGTTVTLEVMRRGETLRLPVVLSYV